MSLKYEQIIPPHARMRVNQTPKTKFQGSFIETKNSRNLIIHDILVGNVSQIPKALFPLPAIIFDHESISCQFSEFGVADQDTPVSFDVENPESDPVLFIVEILTKEEWNAG